MPGLFYLTGRNGLHMGSNKVDLERPHHMRSNTTMARKLVGKLPPRASRGEDYDWDGAALLAASHPSDAVLAAEHVPESRVKSVRGYTRSPFVTATGRIAVAVRNSHVEEDGIRYGDVYFTWESTQEEGA